MVPGQEKSPETSIFTPAFQQGEATGELSNLVLLGVLSLGKIFFFLFYFKKCNISSNSFSILGATTTQWLRESAVSSDAEHKETLTLGNAKGRRKGGQQQSPRGSPKVREMVAKCRKEEGKEKKKEEPPAPWERCGKPHPQCICPGVG